MAARPLYLAIAAVGAVVLIGAGAWAWQAESLSAAQLFALLQRHAHDPAAPLAVALVYIAGGFALVPVTALIALTGLAFDPVIGALYALLGALASGACSYVLGRCFGAAMLRRWTGPRVEAIRSLLQARGLIAVIVVRVVPSGPYTLVNLVAGASGIRARDFLLGTVIGMAPGVVATIGLVHGMQAAWLMPNARTVAAVLMAAAAVALLGRLLRRTLARRRGGQPLP